eukprot:jgi/Ulvmu1/10566/UM065_0020.1
MALDPNHWSSKLQAAFKTAVELAVEQRHTEARVLHLGLALLEDQEGLARQACLAATSEASYRALVRTLRGRLDSLPKLEPAPNEAPPSRELIKLLTAASKQQKKKSDAYMGVDVVLPAVLNHVRSRVFQTRLDQFVKHSIRTGQIAVLV